MRWIACLFFFHAVGSLFAQDAPRIRNFVPADYRGQNQNWALTQSPAGWIYAGNNGGLLEFDGARWQTFNLPENQTVRTVAAGADGKIYCGGFAEFGFWQPDARGLLAYHSLSREVRADLLDKEEIWHILATESFILFQSFSTIYKYDFQKVTVLQPPFSIMFTHEVDGRVLVPVIGRGVYELLPDNTFRFVAGTEVLAGKIVQFLAPHKTGGLWIGTTNDGIYQWENGQCRPWTNPLNAAFKKYQLNKAVALRQGGWAIGTILKGAYVLDADENLRFHLYRENGLQNNTVLALHEDRRGNLLLGLDRGIDLVALRGPMTFFTDLTGKMGTVYSAARWNGRLYVGTNQGAFVRDNGGFRLVEGTQGQVWELRIFGGRLLCGHNAGTFQIGEAGARLLSDVTGGWCTVPAPGAPDLLVQSTYTGLVVLRRQAGGDWRLEHRVAGFAEPLRKILFDAAGNLWGSHPNKGLYRLRLSSDWKAVLEYKTFRREEGLPSDFKLDLTLIDGMPVINAQFSPLRILDSAGQVFFKPLSRETRRQKWLPGNGNEFFVVDSSGVSLRSAGNSFAMPVALVPGYENVVPLGPEEYLFCLENGFALLDKRLLPGQNHSPPAVVIRRLEANGERLAPYPDRLELPYRQNTLRIGFAVPFFEQAPLFSWRLDPGPEEAWSPWQPLAEKEFANLSPGEYVFRVRADSGGPETALRFRIRSPWYRSAWAIAAYGLLLAAVFALLEKISRIRLDRQRQRLEAEKQQELDRQRIEAEREKLALEVDTKNRELSNAALNLIRKNEVLQRLRADLLGAGNDPRALHHLTRLIDRHLEGDHDWEIFEASFNRVHDDFFKRLMLQFADLTPGDLRLAAYLKMNLSSKEIAPLLNISVRGVENKRYRLRKKLGLPEDANLTEFIMGY